MRLAGQMKDGYFPAPDDAIAGILQHLRPPDTPGRLQVLDPCAGEGRALSQLGEGLGACDLHAIELNALRADRIRESYPAVRLLGPCSYSSVRFSYHSMGLVYCNPPFDSEYGGGGREEVAFVSMAKDIVAIGGILVLVCPLGQVYGRKPMCTTIDTWFQDVELFLFPDHCRRFEECVVIGRRRKSWMASSELPVHGCLHNWGVHNRSYNYPVDTLPRLGQPGYDAWDYGGVPNPMSRRPYATTWTVPVTKPPGCFLKVAMTEEELERELARSPLNGYLRERAERPIRRPPLSLNKGHTSLVLLTGLLDGYVPSTPPHVVRGYCGKEEQLVRQESYDTPAGAHVEKTVFSEVPKPVVRAVWPDGTIRTFGTQSEAADPALVEGDDLGITE